jgi:hypothetical protein
MGRTYRLLTVLLALCLCFGGIMVKSSPGHALSGLTVSPPLKEITLGPGLIETATYVTIQNNTGQIVRAHLQLVDLKALGIYGGTSLDKAGLSDKYDLADWMSLPGGDTVIIASGQTVNVKVDITNRDDLSPGGHYGAVVITSSSADSGVKSDVDISQQLVSLMFIKKLGGEQYGLNLDQLSHQGSAIPDKLTTRFNSTGNVHVTPRGFIEVTDPAGKLVAKGILNPDSSIILPGSSRQFVTLLQPVATSNKAGRYKITVHYRYDGQQNFSTESIYFTHGNPLLHTLAIAGSAILFVTVAVLILRTTRRKKQAKNR